MHIQTILILICSIVFAYRQPVAISNPRIRKEPGVVNSAMRKTSRGAKRGYNFLFAPTKTDPKVTGSKYKGGWVSRGAHKLKKRLEEEA